MTVAVPSQAVFGRLPAELGVCHRLEAVEEKDLDGVTFQPAEAQLEKTISRDQLATD